MKSATASLMLPCFCLLAACSNDPNTNAVMAQTAASMFETVGSAAQTIVPSYYQAKVARDEARSRRNSSPASPAASPQSGVVPSATPSSQPASTESPVQPDSNDPSSQAASTTTSPQATSSLWPVQPVFGPGLLQLISPAGQLGSPQSPSPD
jgi:hypothetical protein